MAELIARFGTDFFYGTVLLVVFGAVCALLFGIRYLFASRTDVVKQRLHRAVASESTLPLASTASGVATSDQPGWFQQALSPLAKVATPSDAEELGRLRRRLSHAGFRGERAMVIYLGVRVLACIVTGLLFLWYNASRAESIQYAPVFAVLAMGLGFYAPALWVGARVKDRQRQINHALPDALDLLVTCVEAGLGLDASLNRVAEEVQLSAPLLSYELSQAALEMRAGVSRGDAFRRLASRTGVEELSNLAAMIIQTEIFGTSVGKSLRVQSDAMRVRRMQLAEERAATVGVKLTIPLIFCIMPSLFCVLMGPAAVRIIRILIPKLLGE